MSSEQWGGTQWGGTTRRTPDGAPSGVSHVRGTVCCVAQPRLTEYCQACHPPRCVLALLLLCVAAMAWGQDKAPTVPAGVEYKPDLTYAEVAGETLKIDLAMPKEGNGPFPTIICIHGGGWRAGSRKSYTDVDADDGWERSVA